MKTSIVREKMRRNEPIMCLKQNFTTPNLSEFIGHAGFDCLWICNEHQALDRSLLEHMIRAAKLSGIDTMVRTGYGDYTDLIQPLELGAQGLMIPHIHSAEQVRQIVREVRYFPEGMRGVDAANQDADIGMCPFQDYLKFANENTFLMVQIEDPGALAEVEAIAALPGVDIVFLGPCDYAQSIGRPGEIRHPEVWAAIERTAKACANSGKYCGTPGLGDPAYIAKLLAHGVKFIGGVADLDLLQSALAAETGKYRDLGFSFRPYRGVADAR